MIIFQYNYEALYAFLYSKNITPKIYLCSYCQNLKYQQIQHRKFYTHTQIFSHMVGMEAENVLVRNVTKIGYSTSRPKNISNLCQQKLQIRFNQERTRRPFTNLLQSWRHKGATHFFDLHLFGASFFPLKAF